MNDELRAIAHPTRLSILKSVSHRAHTVGELATQLALRQPATSQHLQILREADLVIVRPVGNKRFYVANPNKLEMLRSYLDDFWKEILVALKNASEQTGAESE